MRKGIYPYHGIQIRVYSQNWDFENIQIRKFYVYGLNYARPIDSFK
jgi:hypothetical protein